MEFICEQLTYLTQNQPLSNYYIILTVRLAVRECHMVKYEMNILSRRWTVEDFRIIYLRTFILKMGIRGDVPRQGQLYCCYKEEFATLIVGHVIHIYMLQCRVAMPIIEAEQVPFGHN